MEANSSKKSHKPKKGWMTELYKETIHFLTRRIWSIRLDQFSKNKSFLYRTLRIIVLALRGFMEDQVSLRASALTFYTLMSIVPILAMGFGIAKGFGYDKLLETQLLDTLKGHEEIASKLIDFSNSLLARTGGGLIAGIGIAVLFWSILKVFGNIERSFNAIWEIDKPRHFTRKFSDYLSMMLIAPILVVASSSTNVYIITHLGTYAQQHEMLGYISPFLFFLVKLIPYFLVWVLFTLIYIVMPNTTVKTKSGIVAGIVAGTLFAITQWIYVHFQVGVSQYNAIYGSFAALPLFLIWMQTSWLIVLLGAEISFAIQNVQLYEYENEAINISHRSKRALSLLVIHRIVSRFKNGEPPLTATDLSTDLNMPIRLVRHILHDLTQANLIAETYTDEPKTRAYVPAIWIEKISIQFVNQALDSLGVDPVIESAPPVLNHILTIQQNFEIFLNKHPDNKLLKDID
jgi:Predicted membrane protein